MSTTGSACAQPKLELRQVCKYFDGQAAVDGADITLHEGEFLSLLGPSGCGKSTTLSMIAGFLEPTRGDILVDGERVNGKPPQRRRIGLVFQDYAVFTRLSVRANLHFGLESQGVPRKERNRRVDRIVERLNLGGLLDRQGAQLNMSEMQRTALARVLVTEPSLLLLDEPMSNLDASVRESLRRELKLIQRDLNQTVLYVTHDQLEAMAMSDRIAIMNEGKIHQVATPEEIYQSPGSRFVAEFIGDPPINMIACDLVASDDRQVLKTARHEIPVSGPIEEPMGECLLGIRPHDVVVRRDAFEYSVPATVRLVENLGAEHVLHLDYDEEPLRATVPPRFAIEGDEVHVALNVGRAHLVHAESGHVLERPLPG